jgi:phosphopantetheinyl transferase
LKLQGIPSWFFGGLKIATNNSMPFAPLPELLISDSGSIFFPTPLSAAMLDLDHLRAMIEDGLEKVLCQQWLHPEEQEKLQTLRYRKRHLEWLGGRICAKKACLRYLTGDNDGSQPKPAAPDAAHLQFMIAESGRPFLNPETVPEQGTIPHVSISHSRGYALAIAASAPCGIDIQAVSDALLRVKDRFCSPVEEELLARHLQKLQPDEQLALLWAVKEAIKKTGVFDQMPGFLDLVLTGILPAPQTASPGGASLFHLDYLDRRENPPGRKQHIPTAACLHEGYGIGLCTTTMDGLVSRAPRTAQERPTTMDGLVSQAPRTVQERPTTMDGLSSRSEGDDHA